MDHRSELRLLIELERAGNARGAAAALGVSQSTLTQGLRRLEHTYGTTLFDRGRSGSHPTATGRIVIDAARHALAALDTARREVTLLGALEDGVLAMGAEPSLVETCVIGVVKELSREIGARQFKVTSGTANDFVASIRRGDIDVYVGPAPDNAITDLRIEHAGTITVVPFACSDHDIAAGPTPGLAALRDHTLAMTRWPDWYYRRLFDDLPLDFPALADLMGNARSLEMTDFGAVKAAVRNGDAIGLGPTCAIRTELAANEFTVLDVLPAERDAVFEPVEVIVATRGDRSGPPLVRLASTLLSEAVAVL